MRIKRKETLIKMLEDGWRIACHMGGFDLRRVGHKVKSIDQDLASKFAEHMSVISYNSCYHVMCHPKFKIAQLKEDVFKLEVEIAKHERTLRKFEELKK